MLATFLPALAGVTGNEPSGLIGDKHDATLRNSLTTASGAVQHPVLITHNEHAATNA
ncbi:MAG TPA: hypothetical protein VGR11_00760 [Solirubrobacteraceae bacterium]|nr:hypothetical protein [Solirubrobacteraceae bacterium]